jgi:hypothetical protein
MHSTGYDLGKREHCENNDNTHLSSNLFFAIQPVGIFIKNVVGFSDAIFLPAVARA